MVDWKSHAPADGVKTLKEAKTEAVERLLKHYLARRDATEQELLRLLQESHDRRKRAAESHGRRSSPI